MKLCALVLLVILSLFFNSNAFSQLNDSTYVDQTISRMSDEDKIGQLFLIGVNGTDFNSFNEHKLRELRPGGIILFGRNIKSAEQVSRFIFDFQDAAEAANIPPLFTAVDQEGGSVTRLKHWPPIPSAAAVGRAGDPDLAFKMALFSGQTLKTLGLNMNLAPVLDLSDPLERSFIGSRSYGENPSHVSLFGGAVITGFEAAGVVTISKHFPGHGGVVMDSHLGLPVIKRSLSYLKSSDMVPFQTLSSHNRLPGLMVAHIAFPLIDTSSMPATYSKTFLTSYLRSELNYAGLIMTDDLEMLGAKGIKDPAERAFYAISAGADIIMVAWNPTSQKRAYEGLLSALKSGRLSRTRVEESVRRILMTKARFKLTERRPRPSLKELEVMVYHRELQDTISKIVTKNLLLSSHEGHLPPLKNSQDIFLISNDVNFNTSFQQECRTNRLKTVLYDENMSRENVSSMLRKIPTEQTVFYFAGNSRSIKVLNSLSAAERAKLHLITTELPFMIRSSSDYRAVFYSYTKHPSLGALFYRSLAHTYSDIKTENRTPANQSRNEELNGRKNYHRQ